MQKYEYKCVLILGFGGRTTRILNEFDIKDGNLLMLSVLGTTLSGRQFKTGLQLQG